MKLTLSRLDYVRMRNTKLNSKTSSASEKHGQFILVTLSEESRRERKKGKKKESKKEKDMHVKFLLNEKAKYKRNKKYDLWLKGAEGVTKRPGVQLTFM